MRFYIDFENIGSTGLTGIDKLSGTDVVRIYYSNDPGINMGVVKIMVQASAKIQFIQLPEPVKKMNLSNALDIVILSDISRQMTAGEQFIVISNDTGYDKVLAEYITKSGQLCSRSETIEKALKNCRKGGTVSSVPVSGAADTGSIAGLFDKELAKYKKDKDKILNIVKNSATRTEINIRINKTFSQDAARAVMKHIKPYIKNLPGA